MTTYTITLTEAEDKALSFVSVSQNDWIQNAVKKRCHIAIEEIVALTVQKCLETNTQIPGSKDAMVLLAFQQGWINKAADKQIENVTVNTANI
jgi:hypothetical protein